MQLQHVRVMAHNLHIAILVEELVLTTNKNLSASEVDEYKRSTLATLSNASSGRINQFEISTRLGGLQEKARILNNEPLANALHDRLQELSTTTNQWIPEVLSLLLHLSDRPVHKARIEDLQLLQPLRPPAPLSWSDIIADDPLDDSDNIWKNIDFTADESDEDEFSELDDAEDTDTSLHASPIEWKDPKVELEDLIVPINDSVLHRIESAQFWRKDGTEATNIDGKGPELLLTEVQAVREVIFMIQGLPTSMFIPNIIEAIAISEGVSIRHVSQNSLTALLEAFANIGTKVRNVRQWTGRKPEIPLEQTFGASLSFQLAMLDRKLSEIELSVLDSRTGSVPTLLYLHEAVSGSTRLIQQLDDVLRDLSGIPNSELPFRMLESLFDRTCASQRVGDAEGYEFMADLFFECLRTYIRPIRLWMEKGQLSGHDSVMFIRKNVVNVPLESLWRNQYELVRRPDGNLNAPMFLHLASTKIFNTGKSVDFLRHMGFQGGEFGRQSPDRPEMTFQTVCQPADLGLLSPFPELFDMAFRSWVVSKHHESSSTLREQLESRCGLQGCLDALEFIYFCRNGALSSNAANAVFEWIDGGSHRWRDNFVLTELFRSAYRTIPCIELDRLEMHVDAASAQNSWRCARRSMGVLEDLRISYRLPWAVANIIRKDSFQIYQRVFVLILQIYRAKYLLQGQSCLSTAVDNMYLLSRHVHLRLLWFVNVMLTYITQMVVLATATGMRTEMRLAADADGMIEVHEAYITKLESRCFLTKSHRPIRQALLSLLDLTVLFANLRTSSRKTTGSTANDRPVISRRKTNHDALPVSNESLDSDSNDDSDSEASVGSEPCTEPSSLDRLRHISDTYSKLHSFITVAVQGVSKADSASCYEMLASSLAAGSK